MILPVTVIVVIDVALLIRVMRSSMLEALNKAYITTARAKGLAKKVVIYKHARRNALIPVITYLGIYLGMSLTSAPVTETVFSWPGLGYFFYRSIVQLDYPAVMGIAMTTTIIVLIGNLMTDVVYGIIDPRIKLR